MISVCVCVSVCTYLSDIHCFSTTVLFVPWYMVICMCCVYVQVCVCVCVYVCKGGVYFNIVSQESISSDFIPSPPPYFSFYLCPVFPFRPLSTGEQGSFVLAEYCCV